MALHVQPGQPCPLGADHGVAEIYPVSAEKVRIDGIDYQPHEVLVCRECYLEGFQRRYPDEPLPEVPADDPRAGP